MPMTSEETQWIRETHDVVVRLETLVTGENGVMKRLAVVERKVAPLESFKLQVVAVASAAGTILGLIIPAVVEYFWPGK